MTKNKSKRSLVGFIAGKKKNAREFTDIDQARKAFEAIYQQHQATKSKLDALNSRIIEFQNALSQYSMDGQSEIEIASDLAELIRERNAFELVFKNLDERFESIKKKSNSLELLSMEFKKKAGNDQYRMDQ